MPIEVTATQGENKATVNYDFGDNLAGATKLFGEQVVYSGFVAHAKVQLQAVMRSVLKTGKDVAAECAAWKPGVTRQRAAVDPMTAALNAYKGMDDKQRKELLAALKNT